MTRSLYHLPKLIVLWTWEGTTSRSSRNMCCQRVACVRWEICGLMFLGIGYINQNLRCPMCPPSKVISAHRNLQFQQDLNVFRCVMVSCLARTLIITCWEHCKEHASGSKPFAICNEAAVKNDQSRI